LYRIGLNVKDCNMSSLNKDIFEWAKDIFEWAKDIFEWAKQLYCRF